MFLFKFNVDIFFHIPYISYLINEIYIMSTNQGQNINNVAISPSSVGNAPISRFCLCVSVQKYNTTCCCKFLTLRQGIILISYFEILSGILGIFFYFFPDLPYSGQIIYVMSILSIFPSILALKGIKNNEAHQLSNYYTWRLIKFLLNLALALVFQIEACTPYSASNIYCDHSIRLVLDLAIFSVIQSYFLFIIFSTANLLLKGEIILVNSGQEVANMMNNAGSNVQPMGLEIVQGIPVESLTNTNNSNI